MPDQDYIEASINEFSAQVRERLAYSEEAKKVFKQGIRLLENLEAASEKKREHQHDAIVLGVLIKALVLEKKAHDNYEYRNDWKSSFGCKTVYPLGEDGLPDNIQEIGECILLEKSLPFDYKEYLQGTRLGAVLLKLNFLPKFKYYDDLYNEKEAHKKLYLSLYQRQEPWHAFLRVLGKIGAVVAAVITPISLFYTIPLAMIELNHDKQVSVWGLIANCLVGLIPIYSGIMSWRSVAPLEAYRREFDDMQKDTYKLEKGQTYKDLIVEFQKSRYESKSNQKEIKWQDAKNPRKPKKVFIPSKDGASVDMYTDKFQIQRILDLEEAANPERYKPVFHTTEHFRSLQNHSVELVEGLKAKYGPKG